LATKEDILEQLVEEFLIHQGYFIKHNVKFVPNKQHPDFISNQDSNHSDIDVLAIHPLLTGPKRVLAVSCKSWQSGFNIQTELNAIKEGKIIRGREAWKGFRELTSSKWSEAFMQAVKRHTGSDTFTYVLAVTAVKGEKKLWEQYPPFIDALNGNPLEVLEISTILEDISANLNTTLAASEIGRLLQIIKASGFKF
jgi:hypothetical protein